MFKIYYRLTSLLSYVWYLDYIKIQYDTCWAIKKHWNNKFYYTVTSCWFFPWDLYYNARIHEHQTFSPYRTIQAFCQQPFKQKCLVLRRFCERDIWNTIHLVYCVQMFGYWEWLACCTPCWCGHVKDSCYEINKKSSNDINPYPANVENKVRS
jgi:hypothetical protein